MNVGATLKTAAEVYLLGYASFVLAWSCLSAWIETEAKELWRAIAGIMLSGLIWPVMWPVTLIVCFKKK